MEKTYKFSSKMIQAAKKKGYDLNSLVKSSEYMVDLLREVLTNSIESSIVESDASSCTGSQEGYAVRQAAMAGKRVGLREALSLIDFEVPIKEVSKEENANNGTRR